MPLTKQYLKYVSGSCLGVVCSRKTGSLLLEKGYGNDRKWYSVSPALENVIIWDLKSGEKVHTVLIPRDTSLGLRLFIVLYLPPFTTHRCGFLLEKIMRLLHLLKPEEMLKYLL